MTDHYDEPDRRRSIEKENARNEVQQVLQVLQADECDLNAFHLLGVVTDPTVWSSHTTDTTLTTVSFFNAMLDDLYSQIITTSEEPTSATAAASTTTDSPSSSSEIPLELTNIDTSRIETYLLQSGKVASAFEEIIKMTTSDDHYDGDDNGDSIVKKKHSASAQLVSQIPDEFFSHDFDLTNPDTFQRILLVDQPNATSGSSSTTAHDDSDSTSVTSWLGLLKSPDAMNAHLDAIEMALLSQVRANSTNFFCESQRFADLQRLIQQLLDTVLTQSVTVEALHRNLPAKTITVADEERNQLQQLDQVLQIVEDLYVCKHGLLGGVLVANHHHGDNDVAAIPVIQQAQALLQKVQHLHAVRPIQEQLLKYEQVVIFNLRDELLDLFLLQQQQQQQQQQQHNWDVVRARELQTALQQVNALSTVTTTYNARVQDTIRMTVRTVVAEFSAESSSNNNTNGSATPTTHASVASGVNSMSSQRFLDCLDMLLEQIMEILTTIQRVDAFFVGQDVVPSIASVMVSAAELSSKSISELLRVRKEAHSLLSLDEMKQVWGRCTTFCEQVETISGTNTSNLRSTLLAQSKAFLERRHETNMAALAAALDSERWVQCEVSSERQDAMTRLSTGRGQTPMKRNISSSSEAAITKASEMEVNGYRYKVVWSCLLLLEMISSNLATSAFFPNLATSSVAKLGELLRLFNARATQLVLGAGAMHSHAKLKSINAKHLSLVTQCLGLVMEILPHVRGTLMAQLPKQQHTLLASLDQVRQEYGDHNEKVLNKLVSIIGGLVERGLSKRIPGTDFDERAKAETLTCCGFLEEVASHTRRMHQVIKALLHPDHLIDTFSKIFAFLDTKVPALIILAAGDRQQVFQRQDTNRATAPMFAFPRTEAGKRRLLLEVQELTKLLNALEGVRPWDFTAVQILEKALEYSLSTDESESLAGSEDPAGCSDGERSEAPGLDSGTDDTVENGRSSREANGDSSELTADKEEVASDSGEALEPMPVPASTSLD